MATFTGFESSVSIKWGSIVLSNFAQTGESSTLFEGLFSAVDKYTSGSLVSVKSLGLVSYT